jgi:DNA-binding MurR/RpiR family transcriptional regulator
MEIPFMAQGETPAVLARIESLLPVLRRAEQMVAQFVLDKPGDVVHMSVTELADASDTSEATVTRLARRLGQAGFASMKISLAGELQVGNRFSTGNLSPSDDVRAVKEKVLLAAIGGLEDTMALLDEEVLDQAVESIIGARRIDVYGVGHSAAVAQHFYASMAALGMPVVGITDPHLAATSAVQLRAGDVAVAVTLTGNARDTVEALKLAREAGATTICLTRHIRSPIAKVADVVLLAAARLKTVEGYEQLDRVAQVAVIEILCTAVLLRKQKEGLDNLVRGRKAVTQSKHF